MAQPTLTFASPSIWRTWLAENHAASEGIWLRFFKKDSGVETVTYAEALEEALCFGWIDGQRQKFDDQSYLQKFTPRRPKSGWSKTTVGHAERLRVNRFSICYRLQTAKNAQTLEKQMTAIIDMLKRGERFHDVPAATKPARASSRAKRSRS